MDNVNPRPLRILLVDDDASIREFISAFLRADGHAVETATSGREAIKQFAPGAFDLVMSDHDMPEMSGEQMALEIKKMAPGVPVLILTGHDNITTDSGQLPPHVDCLLTKPFQISELRAALDQLSANSARHARD